MSSNSMGLSQEYSQKSGKRRYKEKFVGKFNTRTQKLIELSKSNSCSTLPLLRRDSDSSMMSFDGLSQSSGSCVTNREKQRLKRMREREQVKPLELGVDEQIGLLAVAKLAYGELLGNKPAVAAFDILLATLRARVPSSWTTESEEVRESLLRKLIRENVLLSAKELTDKYLTWSGDTPVDKKVEEYKLQTLLRIFSNLPDYENVDDGFCIEDDKLDEVTGLLRMISSAENAGAMQSFLNDDVLETFLHRIPRHLTRIYEDLYQPVPPELSSYASRDSEDGEFDAEVLISPKFKCGKVADNNASQKGRPINRRASFFDSRHHKLLTVSSNGAKELKVKAEKANGSANKDKKGRQVRKSLTFDTQPKHQTPMKKPVTDLLSAVATPPSRTPKRKRLSSALVEETPVHKQRPLSEYRREKFQRISGNIVRQIVAETPLKAQPNFGCRKSPRNHPSTRSFTTAPSALTQLDDENVQGSSTANAATMSMSMCNESSSPDKEKRPRRQLLLQEFLSGHKSPRKRLGKAVRSLLSPRSKPILKHDAANAKNPFDFSSVM